MCQQRTQSFRIQLITDDDAGGTSALEILVAVVICFTAGESYDLCSYVSAKLLLAGAALDIYICADLAVSETYKLQRNDVCSLMQQLVEGMLSVGSGLTEEYRTCHIVHRLTETVYGFTVGLHICLLQMCRETAQSLRIRQNCCCRVSENISLIYTDQRIQHLRILQNVRISGKLIFLCGTFQELCEYFRTKGQGKYSAAYCGSGGETASDIIIHKECCQIIITLGQRRGLAGNGYHVFGSIQSCIL